MATTTRQTLEHVLRLVRENHPGLARGWFSDLDDGNLVGGTISIQARNLFQLDYLQRNCRRAFSEAAQTVTGRLVSVRFWAEEPQEDNHAEPAFAFEELPLNPDYSFENFIVGPGNRLAHAAATAVSEQPGRSYNPLFVHGSAGLGKTHLLQAICHRISKDQHPLKLAYLSCEAFINHFIEAVEVGALHHFRHRFRHVDALVIDDIQFLGTRERSQEEFFHTFNTLHQTQRQIILSADCPPSEIPSLEERLVSRFNSGLVALIDRPCLETRLAILRRKSKLRCVPVPDEVLEYIALRFENNIRELEGALLRLDALSQLDGGKVTIELARSALGPEPMMIVQTQRIMEVVARRFKLKVSALQGKNRAKSVTLPRHLCMYLARQFTHDSLEQIGGYFGGRDHTTVLHATRQMGRRLAEDVDLARLVRELGEEIRRGGN
ncbi:MAG: chromosomal replication initiator protein DnaA [Phycisphaerae bacterium]|nr:chromosomal replication initiator protein DnaA [Phycisphaerae bacterium]